MGIALRSSAQPQAPPPPPPPRASLPQMPCITCSNERLFELPTPEASQGKQSPRKPARAKHQENTNESKRRGASPMLADPAPRAPHERLCWRTSSLDRPHQHQHQERAEHEEDARKRIFSQRQVTYGAAAAAAKHHAAPGREHHQHPQQQQQQQQQQKRRDSEHAACGGAAKQQQQQKKKKKRLSLTSGNFSHQFPSNTDGCGDPEGGGGAGGPGAHADSGGGAPAVSDIIGSFGLFQLLVLLFSGLREGLVGYDALIMSVILQPETRFLCADNLPAGASPLSAIAAAGGGGHLSSIGEFNDLIQLENRYFDSNLTELQVDQLQEQPAQPSQPPQLAHPQQQQIQQRQANSWWNETAQCYKSLDGGRTALRSPLDNRPLECQSWIFVNQTAQLGPSLVAEWSLVCQFHWLIAFIESAYFFGLVTGNLTWGYYADRFGRRPAYLLAHTISLIFGALAIFMPSIYLFALCRFLAAFGSVGYNIIYSIQVELIGVKHRSFSTILNHMGWGLGVICIPLVDRLFDDYRPIIAVAPLLSLAMYPWAFWLPESSRWLMANGRYKQAREELLRAAKFNGKAITARVEKKISLLEQKVRLDRLRQLASQSLANHEQAQGREDNDEQRPYRLIFTNPRLLRDTLILAYLAFVGHLFYYLQTINFAYVKNLSTEANFITSGAGEWVSVLVGAILLKFCTRKTCMSLFLFIMAASFAFQSLIESELVPELDTVPIITSNNGIGTLSSLLLVFIALIVNQEIYPTVARQTGTSITNTIGELGSTLAPLVIQLSRILGAWEANVTYTILCSAGVLFAQFLTRTDDIELPDT